MNLRSEKGKPLTYDELDGNFIELSNRIEKLESNIVSEMSDVYPLPGQIYKHYKGGIYEVVSLATHTETQEKMVVYKSLNFGSVYTRPLDIWKSTTSDGQKRFHWIYG